LSLSDLRALAVATGFPDPDTAAAVAMAESSGYPHAQGDPRGPFLPSPNGTSQSFGLWQVNHPSHPEFDPARLLEADYNAHAALLISSGGTNWNPWSTFHPQGGRPPAYLQFMPGNA
jgi:hypothetical protein